MNSPIAVYSYPSAELLLGPVPWESGVQTLVRAEPDVVVVARYGHQQYVYRRIPKTVRSTFTLPVEPTWVAHNGLMVDAGDVPLEWIEAKQPQILMPVPEDHYILLGDTGAYAGWETDHGQWFETDDGKIGYREDDVMFVEWSDAWKRRLLPVLALTGFALYVAFKGETNRDA